MDEYTFKHCRKGHYYQGEECPYCKAQQTPFGNNCKNERYDMNVCPNGHAYYKNLYPCPYCGEKQIANRIIETSIIPHRIAIEFNYTIPVKVDGQLVELSSLDIPYRDFGRGVSYHITNLPDFDYRSKIEIGGIEYTGRQLIGIIDLIIDGIQLKLQPYEFD